MSNATEKVCKNCVNFMTSTDKRFRLVCECCRFVFGTQNGMNVHSFVRRSVKPTDTCANFAQKTR
ncbi:MAG: hypothetical protein IJ517_00270 [Alphaproteobacteria bacterium]|nr:hypothetical protein [Alphaproteobacteria bacterium]